MTISGSFPGDSELISSFPAQKRAEGDTLLVDHTATGTHNKVSLADRAGNTPSGIATGVLAVWQEAGVLLARLGNGAVEDLSLFIKNTAVFVARAANLRPLRVLRATGESRRIAFVNAPSNTWGFLGITSTDALVLEVNDAVGGSAAAGIDVQPAGIVNVYQGELRVANNIVLHAGNYSDIIPAAPTAAQAVGTYAFAARLNPTTDVDYGDTIAGSELVPAGMLSNTDYSGENEGSRNGVDVSATALSGTWRCMGFSRRTHGLGNITQSATLWLRIS